MLLLVIEVFNGDPFTHVLKNWFILGVLLQYVQMTNSSVMQHCWTFVTAFKIVWVSCIPQMMIHSSFTLTASFRSDSLIFFYRLWFGNGPRLLLFLELFSSSSGSRTSYGDAALILQQMRTFSHSKIFTMTCFFWSCDKWENGW